MTQEDFEYFRERLANGDDMWNSTGQELFDHADEMRVLLQDIINGLGLKSAKARAKKVLTA